MKNGISICRLKSEHNYSEKQHQKNARFMDCAIKTRSIKYSNVETLLLVAPSLFNFVATRLQQAYGLAEHSNSGVLCC